MIIKNALKKFKKKRLHKINKNNYIPNSIKSETSSDIYSCDNESKRSEFMNDKSDSFSEITKKKSGGEKKVKEIIIKWKDRNIKKEIDLKDFKKYLRVVNIKL